MRIAFVTNICSHYRINTFETLAQYHDVDFWFFSAGEDWYWQQQHGVRAGDFKYQYLPGFRVAQTRIVPTLPIRLWKGNYDLYIKCINGRFALPITYLIARLKRKPFVLWTGVWTRIQTPVHKLFFPLTRHIYRSADAIVAYGEHVKHYLISEGVHADRIFIAAHAVDNRIYGRNVPDEEHAALRDELRIHAEHKVVLYLGRLEKIKGIGYLIRSFALLDSKDAVLVIAGDGSERARLEALARDSGLSERIRFAGYIPPDQTTSYYAISWIYVLPSINLATGKELWGLTVNEAFNQGLPAIATDSVGSAAGGLIKDGVNGLVVPERNVEALTVALRRILDDPNERERMSENARITIAEWDNERMVAGFRQAVEDVGRRR